MFKKIKNAARVLLKLSGVKFYPLENVFTLRNQLSHHLKLMEARIG